MIDPTSQHPPAEPPHRADLRPGTGPLGRLGRLAYRNRGRTVAAWALALALTAALSALVGGDFAADYSAPGSDSRAARDLLAERFPTRAGDTINVVVRADDGVDAVRPEVTGLLDRLAAAPHVADVDDPYQMPGGVSADRRTLVAHLRLDVVNPDDMPVPDTERLISMAAAVERPGVRVAVGGQAVQAAERGEIGSEGIGLLAAAVILLVTFGSVVAAGLPIVVAVAGLAVSSSLTGLLVRFVDAPDWSTSLATMMGIGIGVDYALLMVTRFREWRAAGLEPEAATVATMDTAGRSVMVAGGTVMVSMLGLFAMGLSYMRGAAGVAILAVLVVMAASATLFPALLGYLGRYLDRLRFPLRRRGTGGNVEPARAWASWSRLVARHRVAAAVVGVVTLLALAAPFLGVRFGFPDAGNNGAQTSSRRANDLIADGFGAGANGPLLLAVGLPAGGVAADGVPAVLARLGAELAAATGVAAVTPPQLNPAGDTAVITVVPRTGPQDAATEDLVHRLREVTIPAVTAGTGVDVLVGGFTATSIDSTADIAGRLPLLVGGVVTLSMLLLLVAFRGVLIAVKAAVMNLLSVVAAYGVVALVLRGGWFGGLVGVDTGAPMAPFVPILMFAVLFGLSMDYEVFLVSRVREAWIRTGDNGRAVTEGLAGTGRVITAAAAIMVAVFAAFVPSADLILKIIGIGMASAILLDATVIRMLLVPAVMHLLGNANWWMPSWLGRALPELHVEGRPHLYTPAGPRLVPQPV